MNLVCIPYHDWRKIMKEGSRTRDAHFIHHLRQNSEVNNLLIINRPTTRLEILLKKNTKIHGEIIKKRGGFTLYRIDKNIFIVDYISPDIFGQLFHRKKWFLQAFGLPSLQRFFEESLSFLKIDSYNIVCQNIFSSQFIAKAKPNRSLFDAWDNFLLFPDNKNILPALRDAYKGLKANCDYWITNSKKNIEYFAKNLGVENIHLIKNGVDFELFQTEYPVPNDMAKIPRPIIGFGGKLSHLFDYDLFNFCLEQHPDKSFVIVGQKLSEDIFNKIQKTSNFHYLGDKHYSQYPAYVTNFDIGIIPYVNNHLDSGADSIKAYEYLAANLSTIGSQGAGMSDLTNYMYVAEDKADFASLIDTALTLKKTQSLPKEHSWKSKTETLIKLLKS